MPYIRIEITREGTTLDQKKQLIAEATEMMVRVLNKDPASTFVVIDEYDTDNWGQHGRTITEVRREQTLAATAPPRPSRT
ncbi:MULTISPECIES: tautomerase family protein [Variovorax]|jgi:4-oxalocrotonate tautomerase|uniref:tautomerase family protein n=1 Tax=Variovorax TaxID=34072 RepID=UPI00089A3520|nr:MULTISPECIES: 4-oxalocrotonate tautomerase family protein [unclassified Variovorax]SDW19106.1 4-oxalocrotonate tautomerase [Variovorax sp. YR634]SDY25373.1 4-oxalocrotonate tautomerase [Variovorax sp. YR266]SOD30081.1 4-oxalocrotonate tautomerase [Variovorax sp. YR752]